MGNRQHKTGTRRCSRRRGAQLAVAALAILVVSPVIAAAANSSIRFSGRVTRDVPGGLIPPTAETISFVDEAGLELVVSNPEGTRSNIRLGVYDSKYRPIRRAKAYPPSLTLGAGASSQVTIIVPFEGETVRNLRICAENSQTGTRNCGRYRIRRASLD